MNSILHKSAVRLLGVQVLALLCFFISTANKGYAAVGDHIKSWDGLIYTILSESNQTVSVKAEYPNNFAGELHLSAEIFDWENSQRTYKLTRIENSAFEGCSGLTGDLVIPNSVTSIGMDAFYGCSGLTGDLVIPNSITSIGMDAFGGCSGLTGDLVIPNSITSIGEYTFGGCSGLTGDLVIPNSITSIGDGAFAGCSGFNVSVKIPNSVTSIGESAFDGCKKVKHITLPTTLPLISYNLISNSSVEDLTIPQISNVSSINCQNINNIFYLSSTFPTYSNSSPSFGHSTIQKLYVKSTTYEQLKNSSDGSNWISHYTITDKVPVTFPSDRSYITMCRDFDVDFRQTNDNLPAGISPLKAYIVSEIDEKNNAVVLQEITYVPSRLRSNEDGFKGYDEYVGVLLKGTPGYTYYYKIGEDDYTKGKDEQMTVEKALALTGGTVPTGNATFIGCNDPKHVAPEETEDGITYKTYGLKNNQFLAYSKEGYVPYNHAYLRIPTSSSVGAKGLVNLVFKNADGTTSIQSIDTKKPSYEKNVMYNLQGMRVDDSYRGIVIVNGKKILKK